MLRRAVLSSWRPLPVFAAARSPATPVPPSPLRLLQRRWTSSGGGGSDIAVTPTAVAVAVLSEEVSSTATTPLVNSRSSATTAAVSSSGIETVSDETGASSATAVALAKAEKKERKSNKKKKGNKKRIGSRKKRDMIKKERKLPAREVERQQKRDAKKAAKESMLQATLSAARLAESVELEGEEESDLKVQSNPTECAIVSTTVPGEQEVPSGLVASAPLIDADTDPKDEGKKNAGEKHPSVSLATEGDSNGLSHGATDKSSIQPAPTALPPAENPPTAGPLSVADHADRFHAMIGKISGALNAVGKAPKVIALKTAPGTSRLLLPKKLTETELKAADAASGPAPAAPMSLWCDTAEAVPVWKPTMRFLWNMYVREAPEKAPEPVPRKIKSITPTAPAENKAATTATTAEGGSEGTTPPSGPAETTTKTAEVVKEEEEETEEDSVTHTVEHQTKKKSRTKTPAPSKQPPLMIDEVHTAFQYFKRQYNIPVLPPNTQLSGIPMVKKADVPQQQQQLKQTQVPIGSGTETPKKKEEVAPHVPLILRKPFYYCFTPRKLKRCEQREQLKMVHGGTRKLRHIQFYTSIEMTPLIDSICIASTKPIPAGNNRGRLPGWDQKTKSVKVETGVEESTTTKTKTKKLSKKDLSLPPGITEDDEKVLIMSAVCHRSEAHQDEEIRRVVKQLNQAADYVIHAKGWDGEILFIIHDVSTFFHDAVSQHSIVNETAKQPTFLVTRHKLDHYYSSFLSPAVRIARDTANLLRIRADKSQVRLSKKAMLDKLLLI